MTKIVEVDEYISDPAIEIRTKEFLKVLNNSGGDPLETLNPEEARKVLNSVQSGDDVDMSGVEVSERTISEDGYRVKLSIVRPYAVEGLLPAFMFFHGGGWVIGDFPTHQRLIRDLVVNSGAVAVYVDYSRSPEAKFPVAINECYVATKWVSNHGSNIGVDGNRLAVAGNSAGGNIAAVIALMAKHKKGPQIRMHVHFLPNHVAVQVHTELRSS